MDNQVYADAIGAITSVGGTVRLDLVSFSPTEKDARGQPALVFQQRVIMSVEAFLLAAERIQEIAAALGKAGARPRADSAPVEKPNSPIPAEPAPAPAPGSTVRPGPSFP